MPETQSSSAHYKWITFDCTVSEVYHSQADFVFATQRNPNSIISQSVSIYFNGVLCLRSDQLKLYLHLSFVEQIAAFFFLGRLGHGRSAVGWPTELF